MKKPSVKHLLLLSIFLLNILFSSSLTYAAEEGSTFSNGIKPLSYVSCILEDGTAIVSGQEITTLHPKFSLQFDKNVVNMLVWENNRNCISVTTDKNENVLIDVTKIDDTVDFDHRQQIFVQTINSLELGKTYYIKVSPNLTAKNDVATLGGTTDGKGISISFNTKKQQVSQKDNVVNTTEQSEKVSNNTAVVSNNTAVASNNTAVASNSDEVKAQSISEVANTEQPKAEISNNTQSSEEQNATNIDTEQNNTEVDLASNYNASKFWMKVAIGVLMFVWIIFEFFIKGKIKKEGRNKPQV